MGPGLGVSATFHVERPKQREVHVVITPDLDFEKTAKLLEIAMAHDFKVNLVNFAEAEAQIEEKRRRDFQSLRDCLKPSAIKVYSPEVFDYQMSASKHSTNQMSKREQRNRQRRHNY